jgi:putative spermidine/putrescine transport system ATP-binding protein
MNTVHQSIVEFVDVGKTYDGKNLAVDNVNLRIERGEFITFLGPSGSGKTSTLMMLAGFETPTKGKIIYNGRELSELPPHKRNFGMVFQNYALFPHMTVLENVMFPLGVRKVAKQEATLRANRALDLVRLSGLADRRPSQLSGGQQQRVALARALVFEPELVLMDEPLGALDKKLREEMQIELKHLHNDLGVTFVFVTHDQSEALTMSDRIVVFNKGTVQQVATPEELYEQPSNAFVSTFIGETNVFNGTVLSVSGDEATVEISDNIKIIAIGAAGISVGNLVKISIRPERISVSSKPVRGEMQCLRASKLETIYHGSHAVVRFRIASGESAVVNVPIEEMANISVNSTNHNLIFSRHHVRAFLSEAN